MPDYKMIDGKLHQRPLPEDQNSKWEEVSAKDLQSHIAIMITALIQAQAWMDARKAERDDGKSR